MEYTLPDGDDQWNIGTKSFLNPKERERDKRYNLAMQDEISGRIM